MHRKNYTMYGSYVEMRIKTVKGYCYIFSTL